MKLNIKKSKIGSSYYSIEYVDEIIEDGRRLSGNIWEENRKIKVVTWECYQKQLQTLLHENVHGICWEYNIGSANTIVEPLSNGFFAFIIDNPKFIQKILDFAKKIKK